jgi:hypothetical protein
MKTTILLIFLVLSAVVARAQDAASACLSAVCQIPAVVYQAPVIYNAPVMYQAPVVYNAPVYYNTAPAPCVAAPPCTVQDCAPASTVVYIGGGHVGYQENRGSCGSTVTYIGQSYAR